jgi:hypothetical protein
MSDNTDDTNNPDTTDDTGDTGDDSLWSNLKNKVAYKMHTAATDPNANKFAAERAKKRKEEQEKKKNLTTDPNPNTTDDTNEDPNQFSARRLAKKVGNQTLDILKKAFFPFIAIMLAMIVANEAIVYSVPIRIIFFIFTFLVCFYVKPLCILLGIFYILKGGYSYYVNNMTDRPKQEIMPTIYALLPITTYKPMSSLGAFFLYPFTYPKTDEATIQLPETMRTYWDDLEGSFKDLDKVKNLPIFIDELKQIQKDLSELHNPKGKLMTFGGQEEVPPTTNTNKAANGQQVNKAANGQQANKSANAEQANKSANAEQANKPVNSQLAVNAKKPENKPANSEEPKNQQENNSSNVKGAVNNTLKAAAVTGQLLSANKPANAEQTGNKPSNKPANAEQTGIKPANKLANGEQTGNKPVNKPTNAEQTGNKPANGEESINKPANGEQTGNKPENKPANGEQTGNKPENKPANGEQTGNKPENKPANAEQTGSKPANKPANGEQTGNKPSNKPANAELTGNKPANKVLNSETVSTLPESPEPVAPPNSPQ